MSEKKSENLKTQDAKKLKEFEIIPFRKGFVSSSKTEDIVMNEFFQYKEISQIIHHMNVGVEIINYNGGRRLFYNVEREKSEELYNSLNKRIFEWLNIENS